jgi:hypothetical protein
MKILQRLNRNPSIATSILVGGLLFFAAARIEAQPKLDSVIGLVTAIEPANRTATIKSDAGVLTTIIVDDRTVCLRIPLGQKSLAQSEPIKFSAIVLGDRVLAHGSRSAETFNAQRLVVMPASEVERKREQDLDEWKRRGVGGIVRATNPASGEITLELRSGILNGRMAIQSGNAKFLRYVPGSLRYEDATVSDFNEINVGDQLRALGEKSADATRFVAERIISGAFKTIGVNVVEVDHQKNEIHAVTLDQKKPILIVLNRDSVLHRISPPLATAIAQKAKGGATKSAPATSQAAQKPASQPVIDVQQMIDTLPAVSLSDIRPGDVLAVTGAAEKDETRLVAIKLAAGVDLVLKALAPAPGKPQVVRLSAGLPTVFDFSVIPIN